jgi:hypothetical protein
MTQQPFNPNDHTIELKSKNGPQAYLPVAQRLVWFRQACGEGTIHTELISFDPDRETTAEVYQWNDATRKSEKVTRQAKGWAMFKASVTDGRGGTATAHGSEGAADFLDYIEKAETKAIGRSLALLGYGTQFAPEFDEQHRIVDAPVDRSTTDTHVNGNGSGNATLDQAPPSAQQLESLRKLALHLGEKIQRPHSYAEAKAEIERLSAAYNEMVARGRAS